MRLSRGRAVCAAVVLVGACASTSESVAERVRAAPRPAVYGFVYASAGSDLLDCAVPNQAFRIDVDADAGVVVARDMDGGLLAASAPGRALLAPALFASPPAGTAWLETGLPVPSESRDVLARVLGTDLASYMLAEGIPADGSTVAADLIDAAPDAPAGVPSDVPGADAFVVEIDADPPSPAAEATIWVDAENGEVRRVAIRSDAATEEETGWTVEYVRPNPPSVRLPVVDSVDVDDVGLSELRPAPIAACSIGSTPQQR